MGKRMWQSNVAGVIFLSLPYLGVCSTATAQVSAADFRGKTRTFVRSLSCRSPAVLLFQVCSMVGDTRNINRPETLIPGSRSNLSTERRIVADRRGPCSLGGPCTPRIPCTPREPRRGRRSRGRRRRLFDPGLG